MTKSHYVPQAYLRRFLNIDGQLFTLVKNNVFQPERIKGFSTAAKGYYPNFYVIKDAKQLSRYGIEDVQYIEKHFAGDQDNACPELLDKIIGLTDTLLWSDAVRVAQLLLSFKLRNPALRKTFEDKATAQLLADYRLSLLSHEQSPVRSLLAEMSKRDVEESFLRIREGLIAFINHQDFATNVHTDGILQFFIGRNDVVNEVTEYLLSSNWILFETNPDFPFITSDNPGFTFDDNRNPHNLNFGEAEIFCFPLSPIYCLITMGTDLRSNEDNTYKKIIAFKSNDELVRKVNYGTFSTCHEYIFSSDENMLQNT